MVIQREDWRPGRVGGFGVHAVGCLPVFVAEGYAGVRSMVAGGDGRHASHSRTAAKVCTTAKVISLGS